jgi:hypothetical protein
MTASARLRKRSPNSTARRVFPLTNHAAAAVLAAGVLIGGSAPRLYPAEFTEDHAVERALGSSQELAFQTATLSARELAFTLGIREYFPRFSL